MRTHTAIILCVLFAAPLSAIPVRWSTDYDKARAESAEQARDLFLWLTPPDSRHTDHMKNRVWDDEALSGRVHGDWLPVHVENPGFELQNKLGARDLPCVVIVGTDGEARARCVVSNWEASGDALDWLDACDELLDDIDARVVKARENPKDYASNLELARACLKVGRPGMAAEVLRASLEELDAKLEKEKEDSDDPADWDEEVVNTQREFDLTLALSYTRWASVLGSGRSGALIPSAVEIYEEHEEYLKTSTDEHAVHAAILLAYREYLAGRPDAAFRRVDRVAVRIPLSKRRIEVNYWAGFYAWKSGDSRTAAVRLRRVIGFGPSYHPSVQAAENFLRLLR